MTLFVDNEERFFKQKDGLTHMQFLKVIVLRDAFRRLLSSSDVGMDGTRRARGAEFERIIGTKEGLSNWHRTSEKVRRPRLLDKRETRRAT